MPDKVTNNFLAKLFSIEFVISAVVATFVLGTLWNGLNTQIAEAQDSAEESTKKAAAVELVVNQIQMDVAIIREKQSTADEHYEVQSRELGEQRKDIKQILRILAGDRRIDSDDR